MKPEFDAIVIGAGSIGNPTAYYLSKEGLKVLVLEELSSSGQGQNKAAIGGVRATHSDPAKIKICQQSLKIFSMWKEETGTDIGYKPGGYSFPVWGEKEEKVVKGLLPIQKQYHLNIDWYDAEEYIKIVPSINREGLIGGTYSPEDAQVSPLLTAESFTREAKKLGAVYRYRESVTGLIMEGNAVVGARTNKGEYRASKVINTSGAHATAICKMAGIDIPVNPDSHEGGISAPVKDFLGPLIVDLRPGPEGKTINFYFGQNSEGQIIFCYTPKVIFPGENRQNTSEFMPIIARRLVSVIPRLKNLTIRRTWRGLYPMTPDGIPVAGKAQKVENFYLGVGMCGQGFMLGPGMGMNLASVVCKGKPVVDADVWKLLNPERDFYVAKKEALK
jgi:sarcosine oxidase subunit beta